MARLIDADALMQTYAKFVAPSNNSDFENEPTWNDAVSLLESAPTVDAVEVVRCKDCKHNYHNMIPGGEAEYGCTKCIELQITADFYCAWGERR